MALLIVSVVSGGIGGLVFLLVLAPAFVGVFLATNLVNRAARRREVTGPSGAFERMKLQQGLMKKDALAQALVRLDRDPAGWKPLALVLWGLPFVLAIAFMIVAFTRPG